jgi:hypothetical protein
VVERFVVASDFDVFRAVESLAEGRNPKDSDVFHRGFETVEDRCHVLLVPGERGRDGNLLEGAVTCLLLRAEGREDVVRPDQDDDDVRPSLENSIEPLEDVPGEVAVHSGVDERGVVRISPRVMSAQRGSPSRPSSGMRGTATAPRTAKAVPPTARRSPHQLSDVKCGVRP